jgi:hypothetical protein
VPAYDLLTRGFADFVRLDNVLEQQTISRDPLSGILDSQNVTFHTNYYPVLTSGSFGIYVGGVLVPGTANYDTGEVTLNSPPESQPEANYTFTPYTAKQISSFTIQGFLEMEGMWPRGWQLLDGGGAWADENSSNVYVLDGNGVDPIFAGTTFSQSRLQVGFFVACCEYRFIKTQRRTSSITDYMWRESVKGMTIDKSKRPSNLNEIMDDLRIDLIRMMDQAQIQYYGGDNLGGFISDPVTLYYASSFEWQVAAKANNNWSLEGFNVSWRPLTYYP